MRCDSNSFIKVALAF